MRIPRAFITYSTKDGQPVKRQAVDVMYARGEPNPRNRMVSVELPPANGLNRTVELSVKMLERACGFKIEVLDK